MKRLLLGVGLSAGLLLLASQALAAAYVPTGQSNSAVTQQNPGTNAMAQSQLNAQRMQDYSTYVTALQQGTLTADQQKALYQLMSLNSWQAPAQAGMMTTAGQGNVMYRSAGMMLPPVFTYGMSGQSTQASWFGLMFILTVAMVWVALLLLIAFLFKMLKKHKAH